MDFSRFSARELYFAKCTINKSIWNIVRRVRAAVTERCRVSYVHDATLREVVRGAGPPAGGAVSGSPTIAEWSRRGLANRIDPKSHVVVTQHCRTSHIVGALGHSCV